MAHLDPKFVQYECFQKSLQHPMEIIYFPAERIGARGGVVVKALRYKPAGRGFDSRRCHWNFSVT